MDLKRVDDCKRKIEDWYGVTLPDDIGKMFVKFCLENFQNIAQLEKATDLLIQNEPNYGRIPAFKRMVELFREYMQFSKPAYQSPEPKALALPAAKGTVQEVFYRCLCCLDSGLLSNPTLETYLCIQNGRQPHPYACTRCDEHLKYMYSAVRHVAQPDCERIHQAELKRRKTADQSQAIARLKGKIAVAGYLNRPEFREQAIAEAQKRGIPLDLIGVVQKVAA